MTKQLLLRYQIPQYDRHHFSVTGILLIDFVGGPGDFKTSVESYVSYFKWSAYNKIHLYLCFSTKWGQGVGITYFTTRKDLAVLVPKNGYVYKSPFVFCFS